MAHYCCRRILIIFAIVGTFRVATAQREMSVCEALDRGVDHQEVILRGNIWGGWYHGFNLGEGSDADPCPGWRKRFFTSPPVILLAFSSYFGVKLTAEQERLNRDLAFRMAMLDRDKRLWRGTITIKGVLIKKSWPLIFRRADGDYFGNALGQNGTYLAALVITSAPNRL